MAITRCFGDYPNVLEMRDSAFDASALRRRRVLIFSKCDGTIQKSEAAGHALATELVRQELTRQKYAGVEFLRQCDIEHGDLNPNKASWCTVIAGRSTSPTLERRMQSQPSVTQEREGSVFRRPFQLMI